jgi:hypothetical protein
MAFPRRLRGRRGTHARAPAEFFVMRMKMGPKIYISAFEIDFDNQVGIHRKAQKLVNELESSGYQVYMPLNHRDYSIIEMEIDQSDALLALIDDYWTCSTWKASELTWALNGIGVNRVDTDKKPIPCFVFWNEEPIELPFLNGLNKPVFLPKEIDQAIDQINKHFKRNDKNAQPVT